MKLTFCNFSLFILLFFLAHLTYAQHNLDDRVYKTYDAIVGQNNTGLYNGTEFIDLYLNTDGSYRYFKGFDYTKGSVTYKGQYYVGVLLKYDLLEDKLLTQSDDNLSVFNVNLIPQFVDSFTIYNHNFVRLAETNLQFSGNAFFEVAYIGKGLELYIKHSKRKKDKPLKSGIQYKFSESNFYVLKSEGKYSIVNSVKDLRKILPQHEDQIKEYYKTYKTRYKSNPSVFMTNLIKYLDAMGTEINQS
mgnify:CR=1 FL=1